MMSFLLKLADNTLISVLANKAFYAPAAESIVVQPALPAPTVVEVVAKALPTVVEGLKIAAAPLKIRTRRIKQTSLLVMALKLGLRYAKSKTKHFLIGIAFKIIYSSSASFWSYYRSIGTKAAAPFDRSQLAAQSDAVLAKLEEFPPVLNELMTNFHVEMQKREDRLEEAKGSLVEKEKQAHELRALLETIKVEDVDSALENLRKRLEAVLTEYKGNIPILVVAVKELKEAENDLLETQAILEVTRQKFAAVTAEIAELQKLISAAGIDQFIELDKLRKK